jgi:hypothetical protein
VNLQRCGGRIGVSRAPTAKPARSIGDADRGHGSEDGGGLARRHPVDRREEQAGGEDEAGRVDDPTVAGLARA